MTHETTTALDYVQRALAILTTLADPFGLPCGLPGCWCCEATAALREAEQWLMAETTRQILEGDRYAHAS